MKASEIRVGGVYIAKVSNKLTRVRVDAIRETGWSIRCVWAYDVTNLTTGRKTTFRSAAKFRCRFDGPGGNKDGPVERHRAGTTIPGAMMPLG